MYDTLIERPLTQSQSAWVDFISVAYARRCGRTQLFRLQPSVNLHAPLQNTYKQPWAVGCMALHWPPQHPWPFFFHSFWIRCNQPQSWGTARFHSKTSTQAALCTVFCCSQRHHKQKSETSRNITIVHVYHEVGLVTRWGRMLHA